MEESDRVCDFLDCKVPAGKFILAGKVKVKACVQHTSHLTDRNSTLYDIAVYDFDSMTETHVLEVAAQYADRARTEKDSQHFDSALSLWKLSLSLLTLRLPRSKQTAKASFEVGKLLYEQWNLRQEAKSALSLSLEIEQSYDPESAETFEVGNLLGGWLMYNEEYDSAERLLTDLIATETRVRLDHEITNISMCFLGWVYLMTNRKEKAAEIAKKCVEEGLKRHPTSEATAQAFGLLGVYFQHENQLVQAEENYRKAVDIFTVHFPKLIDTGGYTSMLGSLYHLMGQYTDAEQTLNAALSTLSVYFPVSDYVVTTLTHLGLLCSDQRRDQEAETHLKKAIRIAIDFHPSSKLAAHAFSCLAQFHFIRYRFGEAIAAYKEAKKVIMEIDPMSVELATCLCNIGWVCYHKNDDQESEEFFKQSALIFAAAAPRSQEEGELFTLMGQLYHKKQQHEVAENIYIKSLERLSLGSDTRVVLLDLLREEYPQTKTR